MSKPTFDKSEAQKRLDNIVEKVTEEDIKNLHISPDAKVRTPTDGDIWSEPLFMEKLPDNHEDNETLMALQSLIYDDTTEEEIALNFKEHGNNAYRRGKVGLQDALIYYGKGIGAKCPDKNINCALHSNRAQVFLQMELYRRCIHDADKALEFNPNHVKSYFRKARALFELGRFEPCLSTTEAARTLQVTDVVIPPTLAGEMERLDNRARHAIRERDGALAVARRKAEAAQLEALDMVDEMKQRGLLLGPPQYNVLSFPGAGDALPYRNRESNNIMWPTLFLYPQEGQSDFVKALDEGTVIGDLLDEMFPAAGDGETAPWDPERAYTKDTVAVFTVLNACEPLSAFPRPAVEGEVETKALSFDHVDKPEAEAEKEEGEEGPKKKSRKEKEEEEKKWLAEMRKKHPMGLMKIDITCTLLQAMQAPNMVIPGIPVFYVVPKRFEEAMGNLDPAEL